MGFAQPITGTLVNKAITRQEHGPDRINVLDWIQRDPAQHSCSRVATAVRHPGVRRLVDADREQENDILKQLVYILQGHQALDSILTREARNPASSGGFGCS